MKTVASRIIAKLTLVGALVVAVVALVFFEKLTLPLMLTLLVVAAGLAVLALVLTLVFWRCPSCQKRFGAYDVKTEETKVCPYCNEYFGTKKKAEGK